MSPFLQIFDLLNDYERVKKTHIFEREKLKKRHSEKIKIYIIRRIKVATTCYQIYRYKGQKLKKQTQGGIPRMTTNTTPINDEFENDDPYYWYYNNTLADNGQQNDKQLLNKEYLQEVYDRSRPREQYPTLAPIQHNRNSINGVRRQISNEPSNLNQPRPAGSSSTTTIDPLVSTKKKRRR